LQSGYPGQTRYARAFASRRDPDSEKMSRLYVIESTPSATGAKADHRLAVKAADVAQRTSLLHDELVQRSPGAILDIANERENNFLQGLLHDLGQARGSSVVIPGDYQPPVVHALAHAMNAALGNVGKTVFYSDPILNFTDNQNDSL